MTNYREILRLQALGQSQRSIAFSTKASRNSVKDALKRAQELHITWLLDDNVTNEMLDELFYGKQSGSAVPYAVINYEYIHRELCKKGVTLTLLWQEYCETAYESGEKPYMSTQFSDKYRRWARITKATMEGSLKEISYIHSEAYAAGELKHGPISLIEDGTVYMPLGLPQLHGHFAHPRR